MQILTKEAGYVHRLSGCCDGEDQNGAELGLFYPLELKLYNA